MTTAHLVPSGSRSQPRWTRVLWLTFLAVVCVACSRRSTANPVASASTPTPIASATATVGASGSVPRYTYQVVHAWPHDRNAFTQGLIYLKGILFESTGLYGRSSLRKVNLETGTIRQMTAIPAEYFGEGMTVLNDKIFVLTWQNHKGFVYGLESFATEKEFSYTGEGWGLTTDGQSLILSDGTNGIRFLDPQTFQVTRTIQVTEQGQPVERLNELEFIKGEIYANIWQTNFVVRIDPADGKVLGRIDFSGLLAPQDYGSNTDVLNGIAYDASGDRLFVTGKNWPKLFEVRLLPK